MNKQEFEGILGKSVTEKEYGIVEEVYNFHPSISNVTGKSQIAYLYREFGIRVILDMLPTARRAGQIEEEIRVKGIRLEELKAQLKALGKGDL